MDELEIEYVEIARLMLDPENLRFHDERNIASIKSSLEMFGQMKNIVIHHDKVIAGNGTLQAASDLGWTKIAVKRAPNEWTSEMATAYAVADNRTAELANWDYENLPVVLESLMESGINLESLGFNDEELQKMIADTDTNFAKDDNQPNLDEKNPITCPNCAHTWIPS